ncbi:acyltransferase family protein [Chloroflexota bacterium]
MNSKISPGAHSSRVTKPSRLYYLDWLRVLAMVGIFFFHNARFFDVFTDWHVKNATTGIFPTIIVAFLDGWIMPFFFVLAGAGSYFALRFRNSMQFARERTMRLLIPLVFGMFIILVPQAYFQAVSHGEQLGGYNFFQIYGLYLQTLPELNWFHLWFLVYLFVFSLIALPVFLPFGKAAKSVIARAAAMLNKPWTLLPVLVLAIAIIDVLISPTGFWGHRGSGGWNILSYLLFFFLGYLLFSDTRLLEIIKRLRWYFLGAGIILSGLLFVFVDQLAEAEYYFGTASYNLAHLIRSMNSWAWMLTFIGIAARFINFNNRFLGYAGEAVLPFYVLHQTVIISIGFYVVQWDMGVMSKYLIIAATSFIGIMAIYELLVRRINILRFLFGMRLKKKTEAV